VPVVTALRATRRGGVGVHVDGSYVCTVSKALVARWRLHQGRELDDDELAQLTAQASGEGVMADAYRLLGHRARSRAELRDRLLRKQHDEQAVEQALARLQADGLLDDAAFARSYVGDKRRLSGWGGERIRRGLAALGVAPDVVEQALAETGGGGGEDDELDRALAALDKLGPPRPPLEAARRRAYQLLQRRGYSGAVAYAAVRRWSRVESPDDREN
jgi:regulatory protein